MRLSYLRVRTHGRTPARRRRDGRGAAAVETALCLVFILVPLLLGIIEFGAMLTFRQALSQAASEGARATIGAPADDVDDAAQNAIKNVLDDQSYISTNCSDQYTTCVVKQFDCGTHSCVKVTVTADYTKYSKAITFPGMTFAVPDTLTFSSTVEVS